MPIVDGVRLTFGRCLKCNVAYRWRGKPKLYAALCPACGGRLRATTHQLKSAAWVDRQPDTNTRKIKGVPGLDYGVWKP